MAAKDTPFISVPEFVGKVMTAAGLKTQSEFAKKVGVSQGTVSKWLRGTQSPNLRQWEGVLDYVRRNPKTLGLMVLAPDLSLDGMVRPYGPDAEAGARLVLEAYLKTLPRRH